MRIAITLGDSNGIAPEMAIKAAAHSATREKIHPVLVGDGFVIEDTVKRLALAAPDFIYAPGNRGWTMRVASVDVAVLMMLAAMAPVFGQTPASPSRPASGSEAEGAECRPGQTQTSPPYAIAIVCSNVCEHPTQAEAETATHALWHQLCDPKKTDQ